jgi:hypothetical protein
MTDYSSFNPLLKKSPNDILQYYQDNEIPLPDNPLFKDYLNISDDTSTTNLTNE